MSSSIGAGRGVTLASTLLDCITASIGDGDVKRYISRRCDIGSKGFFRGYVGHYLRSTCVQCGVVHRCAGSFNRLFVTVYVRPSSATCFRMSNRRGLSFRGASGRRQRRHGVFVGYSCVSKVLSGVICGLSCAVVGSSRLKRVRVTCSSFCGGAGFGAGRVCPGIACSVQGYK